MNGRNIITHSVSADKGKAIYQIQAEALKFHVLKNSNALTSSPNFLCNPIFLRAKIKNFGDAIVTIRVYRYIGYHSTKVSSFINIKI